MGSLLDRPGAPHDARTNLEEARSRNHWTLVSTGGKGSPNGSPEPEDRRSHVGSAESYQIRMNDC